MAKFKKFLNEYKDEYKSENSKKKTKKDHILKKEKRNRKRSYK